MKLESSAVQTSIVANLWKKRPLVKSEWVCGKMKYTAYIYKGEIVMHSHQWLRSVQSPSRSNSMYYSQAHGGNYHIVINQLQQHSPTSKPQPVKTTLLQLCIDSSITSMPFACKASGVNTYSCYIYKLELERYQHVE